MSARGVVGVVCKCVRCQCEMQGARCEVCVHSEKREACKV